MLLLNVEMRHRVVEYAFITRAICPFLPCRVCGLLTCLVFYLQISHFSIDVRVVPKTLWYYRASDVGQPLK